MILVTLRIFSELNTDIALIYPHVHVEKLQFSLYLDLLSQRSMTLLAPFVVFPKDCLFTCIFHSL